MEAGKGFAGMEESVERLSSLLERAIAGLEERQAALSGEVQRIVATVEQGPARREQELERRLAEAEQQLTELRAQAAANGKPAGESLARKTLPAATIQLLEKQGISTLERVDAGSLDAALAGLSLEQRIAVKSQLLRTGALG